MYTVTCILMMDREVKGMGLDWMAGYSRRSEAQRSTRSECHRCLNTPTLMLLGKKDGLFLACFVLYSFIPPFQPLPALGFSLAGFYSIFDRKLWGIWVDSKSGRTSQHRGYIIRQGNVYSTGLDTW
jgi:hypothetical protein